MKSKITYTDVIRVALENSIKSASILDDIEFEVFEDNRFSNVVHLSTFKRTNNDQMKRLDLAIESILLEEDDTSNAEEIDEAVQKLISKTEKSLKISNTVDLEGFEKWLDEDHRFKYVIQHHPKLEYAYRNSLLVNRSVKLIVKDTYYDKNVAYVFLNLTKIEEEEILAEIDVRFFRSEISMNDDLPTHANVAPYTKVANRTGIEVTNVVNKHRAYELNSLSYKMKLDNISERSFLRVFDRLNFLMNFLEYDV